MASSKRASYFNGKKLPNELILEILFYLRRDYLKHARLTCKKLASLGGQLLVSNLYLSPREKDMQVFDAVSRHPDLKKSVKNITFDSAHFIKYSLEEYLEQLYDAFRKTTFIESGSTQGAIAEVGLILRRAMSEIHPDNTDDEAGRYLRLPVLLQGYQQYSVSAQEHGNVFLDSWFTRAVEGMKRLGPIRSAVIRNSWERIYDPMYHWSPGSATMMKSAPHERAIVTTEVKTVFMEMFGTRMLHVSPFKKSYPQLMHCNGIRTIGSPSAREWHTTTLPPTSPGSIEDGRTDLNFLMQTGKTTGCLELIEFMKLLDTTGKWPSGFIAKRDIGAKNTTGVPLRFFNSIRPSESALFMPLPERLKVLHLGIAGCYNDDDEDETFQDLDVLKDFIKRARSLTSLRLSLPHLAESRKEHRPVFDSTSVFPPVKTLHLPKLAKLHLQAVVFSYRDLASLLFLSLTGLTHLTFQRVELSDGLWEDIVEGLRCYKNLRWSRLHSALFYKNDRYYTAPDRLRILSDAQAEFLARNNRYILGELTRHPMLRVEEDQDGASAGFLARLNTTLTKCREGQL
ncbi:MAG: hypothetical protein Q9169_007118 [Polycauliona sp. 2 TL-2023]